MAITDYGPNSENVDRILQRASALTRDEMRLLSESSAWSRTRGVPLSYAHVAVRVAAKAAARENQFMAAFQSAWRAPYGAARSATRCAVRDAATAAVVSDLVGRHGLTQAHIDILTAPWVQELGSDWMDGWWKGNRH